MTVRRLLRVSMATAIAVAASACSSIGPGTVPRDRSDYSAAIGDSWKQQTLLNIVKLRYGDFPVFMEIAQVIAGYQFQASAGAGFSAQNYISSAVGGPAAIAGSGLIGASYIDRPTIIYAPLTGNDFLKKLMSPIPPAAVMFLLQSGYPAAVEAMQAGALDFIEKCNYERLLLWHVGRLTERGSLGSVALRA